MKMRIRLLIAFFCAHFFATPIAQAQVGFIASGNSLPLAQMIQATARPPAPLPKANCIDKNRAQIVFKGVDVYFCLQKKGEGLELGILSAADDLYSTRQIELLP